LLVCLLFSAPLYYMYVFCGFYLSSYYFCFVWCQLQWMKIFHNYLGYTGLWYFCYFSLKRIILVSRYVLFVALIANIFQSSCVVHTVVQVNITTYDVVYPHGAVSSEWQLIRTKNERTSKLYACCPNPFVDIKFKFVLRRRPTFASHLFIAPSVILCLITPTIFLLPTQSFKKLTLGKFVWLAWWSNVSVPNL